MRTDMLVREDNIAHRESAELAKAVAEADASVLLMVVTQLTGEETLLDRYAPYIKGAMDHAVHIPDDLDRELRAIAYDTLSRSGSKEEIEKRESDPALIRKMMSVAVGEAVPEEYLDMFLCDLGFVSSDHEAGEAKADFEVDPDFKVAVVGAGMSGICAAIRLGSDGLAYEIFDKNDEVGGTWYENRYPGCGVDTPNHFYSFSFEQSHAWTRYFAKRDEIFAYLKRCAEKYGIRDRIRFNTAVLGARFDEDRSRWLLTLRAGGGAREVREFHAVIFAVGGLNRPSIPDIPGLKNFRGATFHTASWPEDASLGGRRVAMIGTGASGMQVAPSIAADVGRLTIFQRSPQWATPNPNYHRSVKEGKKWALKNIPFYAQWYRFQLFWSSADALHPSLVADPAWEFPDRSLNAENERTRQRLIEHIKSEIGDDPELLRKVVPAYPPYGKRMLRDNHWYRTLKRDNVDLVDDPIKEIASGAVVTETGRYEVDCIIFATGFRTGDMLAPIDIIGRDGIHIREAWDDDDARAYLGVTVPRFPNMFILFGPNTILAHGGSAIFQSEAQMNYIGQGLRALASGKYKTMECRQEAYDEYNNRVDEAHSRMVWAHPGMRNWYKNSKGRVVMATPWRMLDYWRWTRALKETDYVWR